jgi:hypothetical protein
MVSFTAYNLTKTYILSYDNYGTTQNYLVENKNKLLPGGSFLPQRVSRINGMFAMFVLHRTGTVEF